MRNPWWGRRIGPGPCGTCGNGARDGGRTRTAVKPRDFKSLVSTSFTTRAGSAVAGGKVTGHGAGDGVSGGVEAGTGIEPVYAELQSAA